MGRCAYHRKWDQAGTKGSRFLGRENCKREHPGPGNILHQPTYPLLRDRQDHVLKSNFAQSISIYSWSERGQSATYPESHDMIPPANMKNLSESRIKRGRKYSLLISHSSSGKESASTPATGAVANPPSTPPSQHTLSSRASQNSIPCGNPTSAKPTRRKKPAWKSYWTTSSSTTKAHSFHSPATPAPSPLCYESLSISPFA